MGGTKVDEMLSLFELRQLTFPIVEISLCLNEVNDRIGSWAQFPWVSQSWALITLSQAVCGWPDCHPLALWRSKVSLE